MSGDDYNFGNVHGHVPYGTTPGSQAYVDAQRGVTDYQNRQESTPNSDQEQYHVPGQRLGAAVNFSTTSGLGIFAIILGGWVLYTLGVGVAAFLEEMSQIIGRWRSLPMPDAALAFWYHYLVAVPIQGFSAIWSSSVTRGLTQWNVLNLIVAVLAEFVYVILIILAWGFAKEGMKRLRIRHPKFVVFVLPAILYGIWYVSIKYF